MEIRRAAVEDADVLGRIAFAAKGYWGYPEAWMERWRCGLTISPGFVRRNEVWAAVDGGNLGEPIGFYALVVRDPSVGLEHLWVSPGWIGSGVGRALFEHAVGRAGALEAEVLEIEADPNAEGFYEWMGARRVGEEAYELDGQRRVLPLLAVDLAGRAQEGAG